MTLWIMGGGVKNFSRPFGALTYKYTLKQPAAGAEAIEFWYSILLWRIFGGGGRFLCATCVMNFGGGL